MSAHPSDLDAYIQHKLANGEFSSRDEFLIEAARVYRELERNREQLRRDLEVGIRASEQGQVEPFDLAAIKRDVLEAIDEFGRPRER